MTKRTGMLVLARPEFRQIIVSHDRVLRDGLGAHSLERLLG
jgi:hypothetical protein